MLLEYDGSDFAGWARQSGERTVQAELETALATIARRPVPLVVAGRTDAGVHARAQVASHPGAPLPVARLNALLDSDVRVLASDPAPDGFDARADALSRTYRYRVLAGPVGRALERRRALHFYLPLDRGAIAACAALLAGSHDFTAFTPTQTRHVRFSREVFRAEWVDEGDGILAFWIEADSFMRHMVRIIVGTMLDVGSGGRTVESFGALLEGRSRTEASSTVRPHGLYLESVRY